MKKKLVSLALVAAMACMAFTACGGKKTDETTLTMATNAAFPPYEYVEGDNITGIDVEIAQAIADKLGRKLEIADVDFDAIVAGVAAGKYDMGMAGMTVTEERKQSVSFTDSYANSKQVIIVADGSSLATVDDLSEKTRIGVQQGTTGAILSADEYGEDAVTNFKTGTDAVQALVSGKLDCVIIDSEPAKAFVKANEGLKILDTEFVSEEYAICVAKDNTDLQKQINDALNELKSDGTVDSIVNKYIKAE